MQDDPDLQSNSRPSNRVLGLLIGRISLPDVNCRISHAGAKESFLPLHAGAALTAMPIAADITGPSQGEGHAQLDAATDVLSMPTNGRSRETSCQSARRMALSKASAKAGRQSG